MFNVTLNPNLYKVLYPNGIPFNDLSRDAFVRDAKRTTNSYGLGGKNREVTIDEAGTGGGSPDFAVANANKGRSKQVTFTVTRAKLYEIIAVDNESIMASKGDKSAIVELAKHAADHAGKNFARNTTLMAWSLGGGSLGVVSSISGATITLATPADAIRFQVGDRIELSEDDGTGAAPAGVQAGGPIVVESVNYSAGTVTFATDVVGAIAAADAGDYLHKEGWYGNAMTGVPGWIPISTPGSGESFFGVDRSEGNVTVRSGIRFTATGASKLDRLIDATSTFHLYGAENVTRMCTNSLDFGELQKELRVQGYLDMATAGKATVSAKTLMVPGANGPIEVTGHRWVPKGYCWGLTMDTWELASAGEWGHITTQGQWRDAETSDSKEMRLAGYGNFICKQPDQNGVFQW